jgi:hypothetical protein
MSVWLIRTGARAPRGMVVVVVALCLLACLRQAFIFLRGKRLAYAAVAFTAAVVGIVAVIVSFLHL